jgi:hypothetical protein
MKEYRTHLLKSCLEIPMFAPEAQPEGSQTCHVWNTQPKDVRVEDAARMSGPPSERAGLLDHDQTLHVWLPSHGCFAADKWRFAADTGMFKQLLRLFIMLTLAVSALTAGCRTADPVSYRLETQPRAVLAEAGLTPSNDPRLALSHSGALHMLAVYGEHGQAQLGLAISHDGGDTFQPPVPVSEQGALVSSHGENSPSLALTPTEIYALWEQANEQGRPDLMFARSLTFGHSFEKPVRVADKTEPSFNGFSSMAVAPDGQVYAVWLDGRDRAEPAGTFSVYLAKSTDRGATFGKNIRVEPGACPCCRAAIAFGSAGEVFVVWRKVFEGDIRDIVVSTSRDGGETFAAPVRVALDQWKFPG